jgi:hypothetical protein
MTFVLCSTVLFFDVLLFFGILFYGLACLVLSFILLVEFCCHIEILSLMSLTFESIVISTHMKKVFRGIVRMPQNDVLDQMSRLLFERFVESMVVPILDKRRSPYHSGCSKPWCNFFCRGRITRSSSRPRKDDLYTKGSGNDDNNETI